MILMVIELLKVTSVENRPEFSKFFGEDGWPIAFIWLGKAYRYFTGPSAESRMGKQVIEKLLLMMMEFLNRREGYVEPRITHKMQTILDKLSRLSDPYICALEAEFQESAERESSAHNSSELESSDDDGSDGTQEPTRSGDRTPETRSQMPAMEQDLNPPSQEYSEPNPDSSQGPSNENFTERQPRYSDIAPSPLRPGSSRSPNRSERPVNSSPRNSDEDSPQSHHMGNSSRSERSWFFDHARPMIFNGPTIININSPNLTAHFPRNPKFSQRSKNGRFPSQKQRI
ncbi:uncharacterized protein LOC141850913 isoform X2 [Brevipalpus obovatus]